MSWRAAVVVCVLGCGPQHAKDEIKAEAGGSAAAPTAAPAPAPTTTAAATAAIKRLEAAAWIEVSKASILLHGDRAGALAGVVAMVDRDDRVPLVDTADLIYPGAKQHYGHGYVVPYDLDHLGDRAGWVLEGLTFRDFGFSVENAFAPEDPTKATARRARARDAVHAWWQTARTSWRCYDALVEAFGGSSPGQAYAWLRGWQSAPCDGFTADRFRQDLLPIAQRHADDPDSPFNQQATLLLRDLDAQLARLVTMPLDLILIRIAGTTPATTVAELEATLGPPTGDIGSGIHIYVYKVADGSEIRVGTADGTSVMYIRLIRNGRESTLYDTQKP